MAPKNFFSMLFAVGLILAGTQQIQAQTYKTGQISKDIQMRERLFKERQRVEQQSPDSKLLKSGSPEKILVSDGQIVYRYVSALAISPDFASDQTIIAAVRNSGLFRSTNAGMSWQPINHGFEYVDRSSGRRQTSNEIDVYCIKFSPNYGIDRTIWLGAEALFKSDNTGGDWQVVGKHTNSIAFSPNYSQDSTVYSTGNDLGTYEYRISHNGGRTWEEFTSPLKDDGQSWGRFTMYDIHLSPFFQADSTAFLSTNHGYFKSINGGRSWVHLLGSLAVFEQNPVSGVRFFSAQNPAKLALAGSYLGLYLIAPEDSTWQLPDIRRIKLVESVSHIVFDPEYAQNKTIFVATAAGIFKSEDEGESWTAYNQGLTDLNIETFAISPNFANDHIMVVGTHEGIFLSQNSQIEWVPRNNGLPVSFGVKNITKSPYLLDTVPTIALDSNDNLHVAWWGTYAYSNSPDGITTDTFYSTNRSGQFESPIRIAVPTGYYSDGVSLAVDKDDNPHLAIRRVDAIYTTPSQREVYYVKPGHGGFDDPILIANRNTLSPIAGLSLGLDANMKAHIVYQGWSTILYTNNVTGAFFTPVTIPGPGVVLDANPSLSVDREGNVHVAYRGESGTFFGDIFYVNNVGGSFNPALNVSRRDGEENRPSLALDSFGKPHFVYSGPFDMVTFYVTTQGDSLATPVPVSSYGQRPSIALDKLDQPHFSLNQGARYATIIDGNIEETEIIVGRIVGNLNVGPRCIVVDQDNTVHVVFSMRANSIVTDFNYDLYLISFTSSSSTGHTAYGSLLNENDSIPSDGDITFQAYIISRPEEILTANTAGGGYKNGVWSVQCASFSTQWQVGDILHVDFTNTATGQTASVEDTLTAADLDLFPTTVFGQTTAVDESTQYPKQFYLSQNYPNPFNPETTIRYQLPRAVEVKLEIFNLLGQRVVTLVEKNQPAGYYAVHWDGRGSSGRNVGSGLFLYRLQAGDFVKVRKLVLIR